MRPLRAAQHTDRLKTPHRASPILDDGTGGELSAVRNLFGAIEAGIRATAPRSALQGLLATLRNQLDATTREIIERGKRRRQGLQEFERAARAAFALQKRRPERPPQRYRAYGRSRWV